MQNAEQIASRPRLGFVDAARTVAMLLMVQAHVCDTLLAQAEKASPFFQSYWLLRGLTAPLFFTISGLAFVVASDPHWTDYGHPGPRLAKRLRRIGSLLLIGYFLQMPRWSGNRPFDFTTEEWRYLLRSGVLHCVAYSLVLAHLLVAVTRTKRAFTLVAATVGLGSVLLTPAVATSSFGFPLPIEMLFRSKYGSLFPIFPFLAYFFLGATLGRLYLDWDRLARSARRLGILLGSLGAASALAGITWRALDPERVNSATYWATDHVLILSRTGNAWLVFAAFALLLGALTSPRWLKSVSGNALSIYLLHLIVIYGAPGVPGLLERWGSTLSLRQAFVLGPMVMLGCALAMAGLDLLWARGKLAISSLKRAHARQTESA